MKEESSQTELPNGKNQASEPVTKENYLSANEESQGPVTSLEQRTSERPVRGLIARAAIQCQPPYGKRGDFLYSGDSPATGTVRSPVFINLSELFDWTKANGWKEEGSAYVYRP